MFYAIIQTKEPFYIVVITLSQEVTTLAIMTPLAMGYSIVSMEFCFSLQIFSSKNVVCGRTNLNHCLTCCLTATLLFVLSARSFTATQTHTMITQLHIPSSS